MRKFLLAALFLLCQSVFADYVDIDIPEISPVDSGSEIIPAVEGYELDGTEEKMILPYKKFTFSGKIGHIEVLKKRTMEFMKPVKKGAPLYRMSDNVKVSPVSVENKIYPSIGKFSFNLPVTFKDRAPQYSMKLYPVIPAGETKVVKIDRIRVHLDGGTKQTMAPRKGRDSLLILTSELVKSKSKELGNYIDAKRAEGFRVDIITEKDYEGGNLTGTERAQKIRSFLSKISGNYHFLLIIADPLPGGSDVPMIVARPNRGEVETDYEAVPTDIFYADVNSDIDSNKNGKYAERADMIVLSTEFVVGRIPFYYENVGDADKILERTVRYIKESPSKAKYRKKILFPASIAYYAMQDGQYGMPKMDGTYVVQYLKENILDNTFITKTLVEKEGGSPSEFTSEDPLSYDSMLKNWNDSYGAVYWMGHGMPTYSVRTIWTGDRNGNTFPDSYEMDSLTFVDSGMAEKMEDRSPFVFMGSCLNGTVEETGNLAFSILLNSSVGVVAASQVSYGSIYSDYDISSQDIFSYGVMFIDALKNNMFPAQVLQEKKEIWSNSSVLATVKMELNYFGDPSLNLNLKDCVNSEECDDGIYCNGTEICLDGFCEKNFDAIPCGREDDSECRVTVCDEVKKACIIENRPDGFYCGETGNLCFSGKQCVFGECIEADEKNCTELDSPCSSGICNSSTGLCELKILNEGAQCDDGLFCTENETCSNGVCKGTGIKLPEEKDCLRTVCDEGLDEISYLTDTEQNWKQCVSSNGLEGFCHYGICEVDQNSESDNVSGCSITVL